MFYLLIYTLFLFGSVQLNSGEISFREMGELLYGKRFPSHVKGNVDKFHAKSVMLYCGEVSHGIR